MNEKKAKALRRQIYGDLSLRAKRRYVLDSFGVIRNHPSDHRAAYQAAKK